MSPLLYTLYTSDCSPSHPSNLIIKFADDNTVVGLISGGDETAYRDEVQQLSAWGSANNLQLNTSKTKEIIIDFRRHSPAHAPLHINGDCVERVPSCKFLGTYISQELSWSTNTTAIKKKAQQRLHFLRILRKNHLQRKLLVSFYRSTIESVLTYCITAWYAGSSPADRTALQRVIGTAQKITGCPLPFPRRAGQLPLTKQDQIHSKRCCAPCSRPVRPAALWQIGRASCRERVCQYV